ncbi:MAG: hypothetical protein KA403_03855 [Candidatus Omnitrophica bacterium]|nr:hypothetical protein [Candidatus Omnitrophota bacterium]
MNSNIYKIICVCALIMGSVFIGSTVKSIAQENQEVLPASFPGVVPFTMSSGRFGFFEQGTGRIFLYDDNLNDCIYIGQLKKLGEPVIQIK